MKKLGLLIALLVFSLGTALVPQSVGAQECAGIFTCYYPDPNGSTCGNGFCPPSCDSLATKPVVNGYCSQFAPNTNTCNMNSAREYCLRNNLCPGADTASACTVSTTATATPVPPKPTLPPGATPPPATNSPLCPLPIAVPNVAVSCPSCGT